MDIDLSKLNYSFRKKPLLVGGKAMEYYKLRESGKDIDFLADSKDIVELIKLYPNRVKDLNGDLGVCPYNFEIWRTICYFDYSYYTEGSIEKKDYHIITLEKLLLMKALAMKVDKYLKDVYLIVDNILSSQGAKYEGQKRLNKQLLSNIENICYIERIGE